MTQLLYCVTLSFVANLHMARTFS